MSFVTPLFLAGLAAAALPVLYHLVRRMTAKRVPFSAVRFLTSTPKEVVRRRRLRDLLLMAVRMALFALLAVVFARPFLPADQLPFVPERQAQSVVLLVDASYSMQHAGRFEAARRAALARLEAAGPDDEFAVVLFSDEAQPLTRLSADRGVHRAALEGAAPTFRTTDFYGPLRLAEELLQDATRPDRRVVLVSDFQQAGWSGAMENWTLRPGLAFEPVRIDEGAAENAYIDAFHLTQERVGATTLLRFDARVAGREAVATDARLVLEGATAARRPLPTGGEAAPVTFRETAAREGALQGHVEAGTDELSEDNRAYFTTTVASRPGVLVLGEAGRTGGAFFVRNALDLGEAARYRYVAGTPADLSAPRLARHRVVVLAGAPALTQGQRAALRAYAEAGGGVVLAFDEGATAGAATALLDALGVGTAEAVVNARRVQDADAVVGEVDLRHPVFRLFGGAGASAIFRPLFRRYVRVAPAEATTVVGRFDTGDPFLLDRALGAGRVLVYTGSLGTAWTDFPLDESYVPFVYELIAHAGAAGSARQVFTVGEAVPLPGRPGDTWEVRTPDDRLVRVAVDTLGASSFRGTDAPGHYTAARGSDRFLFSVNVDPAESNLAARDADEAYAAVVAPDAEQPRTAAAAAAADGDAERRQKGWRLVLLAVLALFVLETLLANRTARIRQPASA